MGWMSAGDYTVALDDTGKVLCRNKAGKLLKSVPSKIADEPAVVQLRQLTDWLARHERECLATAERWMIRSLPVPAPVLVRVWPDPAWRAALRDLVVTDADGAVAGFLRDADPERGIGLVDLDGDSVRTEAPVLRIPHPVLLDDLDELRDFATELGLRQGLGQLHREVWRRGTDGAEPVDPAATSVDTYAGGVYKQLRFLIGRATSLGYRVRGGQAVCPVVEDGTTVEARVWLGEYEGSERTETGPLSWNTPEGRALRLADIGPVAWSEGMRMAAALHAGRDTEEDVR
ncbi:DUF4132 domain-containing protein [Streptomyces sp. PT12]|uniref:DUF4132 domain-containing protein n=1 Tax=Streptomyces sp. PT12 TaxID=1510197 RepID=UPI000DE1E10D|nr:DUF4132 domain-containing protein [Streptomyces sp. PT12]RBM24086.1 hypothetical protein DEH69_01325 [Streptomyces sp. PT12]